MIDTNTIVQMENSRESPNGSDELERLALVPQGPWDTSTREWEVQRKEYTFSKHGRKLQNDPKWKHWRYYSTEEGAHHACWTKRRSRDSRWVNLPTPQMEALYPLIPPIVRLTRYRVVKRK